MNCKFDYVGKTVLITGAAAGIGLATAEKFLLSGAFVILNDLDENRLYQVTKRLSQFKSQIMTCCCDITNEQQMNKMVKEIFDRQGSVDILINNAGIITRAPLLETEYEIFLKELEIDLLAPFQLTKKIVPCMINQGGGKIINMCSVMSDIVRKNTATYAAAKGGLKMLTRGMASEWGEFNIQCNAIAPGYIETDQTAPIREENTEFYQYISKRTVLGRWGKPDDVTGAILFLASEEARYITGQTLYVDGGMMIYVGEQ